MKNLFVEQIFNKNMSKSILKQLYIYDIYKLIRNIYVKGFFDDKDFNMFYMQEDLMELT